MADSGALSARVPSGAAPPQHVTWLGRLRNVEPVMLLWIALIGVLLFLVAFPLAKLFVVSFEDQRTGAFTLANYAFAYGRERYINALVNSLLLGLASATLAVILAVPMAWAVSRTDMPGSQLIHDPVMILDVPVSAGPAEATTVVPTAATTVVPAVSAARASRLTPVVLSIQVAIWSFSARWRR